MTEKARVGGSCCSTGAAWIDLDDFQCLLGHKDTRLRLPVLKRFALCAALFVPTARPCFSLMERTIQNRGAIRDGDSAWSNLPKRGALPYGSEAAEGRVSPEPLVSRLLNRSDQQERRTERHIAQKGARSNQSNHAVSRTPRSERSHWPKVSFRCLNWSGKVIRSRLSTSHLRPSQAGSARTTWPVKSR